MKYIIFGESHGPAIGVALEGLPSGIALDMDFIASEMARRAPGQNAMTTAPYLVIGTSPFNGMDTVDECDSLEEAREFANEHGGKVVKASEYHPKGLLEDWLNSEPEDFGVLPGIDFPATLHRAW